MLSVNGAAGVEAVIGILRHELEMAMALSGCATTGRMSKEDPFEPWNRAMYDVNEVVDGKFVTSSDRVGTHAQLPAAIDELVNKARAERPKG